MVRFITFEGGDGTGKSTQIAYLNAYLTGQQHPCLVTREPGGTTLGTTIRKMLLDVGTELTPSAELFLYLADRAQHVQEVILPALKRGLIVLSDRYTDSTLAYQGYGRGLDLEILRAQNTVASAGLTPDLTFLLDSPVEVGLRRTAQRQASLNNRAEAEDRFETEQAEFHQRVRAGFLAMARAEPSRFCIIDATPPTEKVAAQIRQIVDRELAR